MLNLPDVTLIATTSIDVEETIEAMKICMLKANFGKAIFVSHQLPDNLPQNIEFHYHKKIENIMDFNHLMWEDLWKYFDSSHCLTVQNHAYILDKIQWQDEWLDYSYIGAPWPIKDNAYLTDGGERVRVGNGGFSLRSKQYCYLPTKLGLPLTERHGYYNEDGNGVVYYRQEFIDQGIIYAPVEVAAKFSYETPVEENQCGELPTFGFHRNKSKWMINNNL